MLAGVLEPYDTPSEDLLGRFAGVTVSSEKIQALVRQDGARASEYLSEAPADEDAATGPASPALACVAIDGGMIFVDGPPPLSDHQR